MSATPPPHHPPGASQPPPLEHNPTVRPGAAASPEIQKVISDLQTYNQWRRGNDESVPMPHPTEIGITIDQAIKILESIDHLEPLNSHFYPN